MFLNPFLNLRLLLGAPFNLAPKTVMYFTYVDNMPLIALSVFVIIPFMEDFCLIKQ
jgi:hypothetical protein